MIAVRLKDVKFTAYHGVHPQEELTGGPYVVNLTVWYEAAATTITEIGETINYERLFEIVRKEMNNRKPLLETVAQEIARSVHEEFPNCKEISIDIDKVAPPIAFMDGGTGITLRKIY
jgi:dihydroneopterin aldolase